MNHVLRGFTYGSYFDRHELGEVQPLYFRLDVGSNLAGYVDVPHPFYGNKDASFRLVLCESDA